MHIFLRVPVHTFHVAVCSLPGNRFAGARRSLVADLGKLGVAWTNSKFMWSSTG